MTPEQGWMATLKSIAERNRHCISADRTIEDAVQYMIAAGTSVVVFLEKETPVGIMTERDVVSFLQRGISPNAPLSSVTHPPLTVTEEKTLLFGLNMLIDNNIRRLIVVDAEGAFIGVVTQDDLIRRLEGELYQQDARIIDVISTRQALRAVDAGDNLSAAVEMMTNYKVGSVLVMEKDAVAGIITERDMLRIAGSKTPLTEKAGTVMSRPVVTATIDSSVHDVLAIMKARTIRRLLITYNDGAPFRVITNRDILRNIENSYLEFLNSKIRHAREILDFLPEIILEVIDVSGEQVIQWGNRRMKQAFNSTMANLPVTDLIPAETWGKIYPEIVNQGRIEKVQIELGDRIFELSASYMKMQREGIIQAILLDVTSEVTKSSRDYLTGAYNRRKFDELLDLEIERVKRYGRPLSLALLDIDHFKRVNDAQGHQAGDSVLQELTSIVVKHIRELDSFARYGGEEFVVLTPGTNLAGARRLAEKLRRIIEDHTFLGLNRITVSLGVAQLGAEDTAATLFERADAALYRAKAKGRNRVETQQKDAGGSLHKKKP